MNHSETTKEEQLTREKLALIVPSTNAKCFLLAASLAFAVQRFDVRTNHGVFER